MLKPKKKHTHVIVNICMGSQTIHQALSDFNLGSLGAKALFIETRA
jgi:hypothetical protein